jgi:ArsR family transcriptional regulator
MTSPSAAPGRIEEIEVCCPPVLNGQVSDKDAALAAKVFKALAEPARVRLISTIAAGGADGTCVCELVEPLDLSQPTVSHHLKVLYEAGLVSRQKRGTWAYYRLRPEAMSIVALALHC